MGLLDTIKNLLGLSASGEAEAPKDAQKSNDGENSSESVATDKVSDEEKNGTSAQ